ncbi:MAG TPA: glycosyltransferase family 87 protein, partial [Bacteroidia bacterium]|nr:glycosyltransferase family 87 protein [Bacteroidia bacterium]
MESKLKIRLEKFFYNKTTLQVVLILISLLITIQNILLGVHHFWGGNYTFYNNYVIFRQSWFHLLGNTNLYSFYSSEQADLFKYSPSFAFFMGLFAYLPDWAGLFFWNMLNCIVLFYSLVYIREMNSRKLFYMILFILLELILSTMNSQSNALLAGLMILSFNFLEKGKNGFAALFLVLSVFIKIFSLAGCILFLFYPKKIKSILFLFVSVVIVGFLPLLIITPHELYTQYQNWWQLLQVDHSESMGMSVYSDLASVFHVIPDKTIVLLVGLLFLLSPLVLFRQYSNPDFRMSYLSLILIWIVVFNHKAESPSYIIAIAGCAIWGIREKISNRRKILLITTLIFTSLFTSDIIPDHFRETYLNIKLIKSFMSIIVSGVILFGMFRNGLRKSFDEKTGL